VLPKRQKGKQDRGEYGGILHIATDFSQSDTIKLMLRIGCCLPESYDVLYCQSETTTQDLQLFTERCCQFGHERQFYFLEINRLQYEQQEVCIMNQRNAVICFFRAWLVS
jgi:hypothetical protein